MCAWDYSYKTREGTWCEGRIEAPSREAAFAALKRTGIRPIKVTRAPGFVNWLKSLGKRWAAIGILTVVLAIVLALGRTNRPSGDATALGDSLPRQRIEGLPSDFPAGIDRVFPFAAERFFALHAEPGIYYATNVPEACSLADFETSLAHTLVPDAKDPAWCVTLKRIVNGMKNDARLLYRDGKRVAEIELWLRERQKMESTYRNQVISGPGSAAEKARRLKAMGL